MAYKQTVKVVKSEDLLEAKQYKTDCQGLAISFMVATRDESKEYNLLDFILSDTGVDKFIFSIDKESLLAALDQ